MLERLITSKTRTKILQLLLFNNEELHLREIARLIKITPIYVKKELDNLEKLDLIIKTDKANLTLYKINNNSSLIIDLRSLFIKTDFIGYPINEAFRGLDLKYVLIFGSFAEGSFNSESDIDLLVIGEVKQADIFKALKPAEKTLGREINPIVWTLEELKRNRDKGIVKDIIKKSKIMIKGDENEFQRVIRE